MLLQISIAAHHVPQCLLSLDHGTIMTGKKKYSEEKKNQRKERNRVRESL